MGFGSFFKGLGKGLLKIAPFAATAIPGIGPGLSIALQAGLGAANSAVNGGGLKGALLGAGTGALSGMTGGLGSAAKGLGPSSGMLSNIGNIAKQTGSNALTSMGGVEGVGKSILGKLSGSDGTASPAATATAPSGVSQALQQVGSGLGPTNPSSSYADALKAGQQQGQQDVAQRRKYLPGISGMGSMMNSQAASAY